MKYNGIIVSDLHIDVTDVSKMYAEIREVLFGYIRIQKKLDFMIFCGDYFDHKEYLNDLGTYYAFKILDELFTLIYDEMKFDTKIRFVYGTESHECNQYEVVNTITRGRDIRVIKYAESEYLFDDLKILYLPEEHLDDAEEYYKSFIDNEAGTYDLIFGHGVIAEIMKEAAVSQKSGGKRKRVPIFTTGMLRKFLRGDGQCYFGHYHIRSDIDESIFYVGSFTRWQFGEEEPKGFYSLEVNTDKEKYKFKNEFHENGMAPILKTIAYGYDNEIFKSVEVLEKQLKKIDELISQGVYDRVRLEFNIPSDSEAPEFLIDFIRNRYKFSRKVKTHIVHGYMEEKKEKGKREISTKLDKYAILFDKNVSIEDKVSKFIEIEFSRKISSERVGGYLSKPLSDIMKGDIENE